MIARIWRGATASDRAEDYLHYLERTGLAEYRATPGNHGVQALVDSATGLVGRSVWTDDRGDQVFSELEGEGTAKNNHLKGTFLGGTGRFAGVTGTYEFSWQNVLESEDGAVQGRAVDLKGRVHAAPQTGDSRR